MNNTKKNKLYETLMNSISIELKNKLNEEFSDNSILIQNPNKVFKKILKNILNINPSIPNFVKSDKYNKIIASKVAPYIIEARCVETLETLLGTNNESKDNAHIDFISEKINVEVKSSSIKNEVKHKITDAQASKIIENNSFILIPKYYIENNRIFINKIGIKLPKKISDFYKDGHLYYDGQFFDIESLKDFSIYKIINPNLYAEIEDIFDKYGQQHFISIQQTKRKYKEVKNVEEFFSNIILYRTYKDLVHISLLEIGAFDSQNNRIPLRIYNDSNSTIYLKIE